MSDDRKLAEELARIRHDAEDMVKHYPHDRLRLSGAETLELIAAARAEGYAEAQERVKVLEAELNGTDSFNAGARGYAAMWEDVARELGALHLRECDAESCRTCAMVGGWNLAPIAEERQNAAAIRAMAPEGLQPDTKGDGT